MAAAIALRVDYDDPTLRRLAKGSKDANQTRRLLALAVIYGGGTRSDAAEVGGVTLQIVRDWVLRFNAEGPSGLIDRKAPGARPKLNAQQRQALAERVERRPVPAVDGVVRWRLKDLPPRSPELNPVENIWQFLRDNWLSNGIFQSYDQILDLSCEAWNKLVEQPWTIMSIGTRDWAHRF